MEKIKEDHVSFDVAKLLKEKHFDEICRAAYTNDGKFITYHNYYSNYYLSECGDEYVAPTHQMAMKWLREKDIIIVIQPEYFNAESKCRTWVVDIWASDNYEEAQGDFLSYEEAAESGIKYCLENLI